MKQRCESCKDKADCVATFGIYWGDKSGGGVGCEHPIGSSRDRVATGQDGEDTRRRLTEMGRR